MAHRVQQQVAHRHARNGCAREAVARARRVHRIDGEGRHLHHVCADALTNFYAINTELEQHHLRTQTMCPAKYFVVIGTATERCCILNRWEEKIGQRQHFGERLLRLANRPQPRTKVAIKRSADPRRARHLKQLERCRTGRRRYGLRDAAGVNKLRSLYRSVVNVTRRKFGRGRTCARIAELMPSWGVMHKVAPSARVIVNTHMGAINALVLPQVTQAIAENVVADARDVTHTRALSRCCHTKIGSVTAIT